MYHPAPDLDLHGNQGLPLRYESEEEDISESEGHASPEHASPVDAHTRSATLDSIMSVDDQPVERPDRPSLPRLLSPFTGTGKTSRPVSMDTVKRSSTATFATEPCTIFDHDDEAIIELPSPDSTTPQQSPIFLQPAVYVPSEPLTSPRHSLRSISSASVGSDDESDVCVAEQVTYVEHAKPSLILISPTATSPSNSSVYSNDEASISQPALGEPSQDRGRSRSPSMMKRGLRALDTSNNGGIRQPAACEPMSAPALEAPQRLSFRARSKSFSRPQTPATGTRRRLQKEPPRRPPSAQSTVTFSLFPTTSYACPPDEYQSRSISAASSEYSPSSSQPPSRTASPSPYYTHADDRNRSGSLYSVSSLPGTQKKAPPFPYRSSMAKGSNPAASYSSRNLRAELDNLSVTAEHPEEQESPIEESTSKARRKKSMKRFKQSSTSKTETSESSAKSFVGFMLRGRRKSVINPNI